MKRTERIEPGPGQESVWDYPRPPRLEARAEHIQVIFNGVLIADTHTAKRILETSHPPVYYITPGDVRMEYLTRGAGTSYCEWKGRADYYDISVGGKNAPTAAWFYPAPDPAYAALRHHIAFYPSRMDACLVDGEPVRAQPGDFYGGWITNKIVGPFKGDPGTQFW
ncbi:MAG: DUF427 domain-containing protein [Chloroflexia bacterium]